MQHKNIILITFLFLSILSKGQELNLASDEFPEHRFYNLKGEVFFSAYRQIQGSAYLTDDWEMGDIYLSNGKNIKQVQIKFDVYVHTLLVYNDYLKRVVNLPGSEIDHFTLKVNDTERQFKRMSTQNQLRRGYDDLILEILQEGNISVYKLYYRDIVPLRVPEMPYIDEFINEFQYYLYMDGQFETARLSKSYLKKKFPQYKLEIRQFVKSNKLHLRQEGDFAKVIYHLSQLTKLLEPVELN